ncbi:MAG: lipopolysaccharide heptosyltransferase I [Acidobacteriota bacterium]
MERILIIKLGSLGDVVHTLPALVDLKRSFPDSQIDWLVERRVAVILQGNPLLHQIIEVDTQLWRRRWWTAEARRQLQQALRTLRSRQYDLALDFQGLWKSAAFGFLSGARCVLGFDREGLKEPGCRILYSGRVRPAPGVRHVIEIYRELVRSLGVTPTDISFPLQVSEKDEAYVASQLDSRHLRDFVILNPGGGWVTKNWDPERYAELHLRLRDSVGLQSVLTWGPGEERLIEAIFQRTQNDPPVAFPTTIPQFIALARRARLFIGGDTGPMHLAAACNTPVVGIFGPTSSARNGSFRPADLAVSHDVPCGPCYKRTCEKYQRKCLQLVTVDDVYNAVLRRLNLP